MQEDFDQEPQTSQVEQKEVVEQPTKVNTLEVGQDGLLVGNSLEQQWRIASAYAKSGLVPQALNTPEKVLVAMQFARELGLPPVTAMRQICIINGTPSLWGDLPLSLAMKSGSLEDISEDMEFDKDGRPFKATCALKRKGISTPVVRTFSMDQARTANLSTKAIWKLYPQRMLQCRARAWALKDLFPDMLNGCAIAEYDFDTMPVESENKPAINLNRSSLNDRFSTKQLTNEPSGDK